jgi:hypothetical protein
MLRYVFFLSQGCAIFWDFYRPATGRDVTILFDDDTLLWKESTKKSLSNNKGLYPDLKHWSTE